MIAPASQSPTSETSRESLYGLCLALAYLLAIWLRKDVASGLDVVSLLLAQAIMLIFMAAFPPIFTDKYRRWARWGLLILGILQFANAPPALFVVTLAYLLSPKNLRCVSVVIVLNYICLGLMRLNTDWLSGHVLQLNTTWSADKPLILLSLYIVVLYLAFSWSLLRASGWWRWLVWLQLLAAGFLERSPNLGFNLTSVLILCALPLIWLSSTREAQDSNTRPSRSRLLVISALCTSYVFVRFALPFPAHEQAVAESRHLLCSITLIAKFTNGHSADISNFHYEQDRANWCNTSAYLAEAAKTCGASARDPRFSDLDFFFAAQSFSEPGLKPIIEIRNFCAHLRNDPTLVTRWNLGCWKSVCL